MPPKFMPPDWRELLKDDLNGDTALDTISTAKEGVLQRLELSKRDNGCISWSPDFTPVRGTRLQNGLLQSDQQLHGVPTLQIIISGEDGPHGGASLAEAGLHGMLDLSVLMKQHAQVGEGLAAFQMLTSRLPGAIMVSPTKTTTSVLEMLMVRPLAAQNDCMESNSCCSPCADDERNATSLA